MNKEKINCQRPDCTGSMIVKKGPFGEFMGVVNFRCVEANKKSPQSR